MYSYSENLIKGNKDKKYDKYVNNKYSKKNENNKENEKKDTKFNKNNDNYINNLIKGKRNIAKNNDEFHPFLSTPKNFNLYDDKRKYAYPKNIFSLLFYTWAKPILTISNTKQKNLQYSDYGEFHPDYHPDAFLNEIKTEWQKTIIKTRSNPLIKSLFSKNYKKLIFAFLISVFVTFLDSYLVILYEEIIIHLDPNSDQKPKYKFLTTIFLLLFNKIIYTISYRAMETYTSIYSYKIISQIDVLIYDKLLRISPFSNCSEGVLVNFIQSDAESFGEFFSYTPTTLVLPFQIIFFCYILFRYFGKTFIFGVITLVFILIIFTSLQKLRAKYQKELLIKKDKRMKTTTQIFEKIKIVKLYSWENYYLNRIKKEREEELSAFQKAQIVYLLIESITWAMGPILNFVSVFIYNLFNPPMELPKLLSSLYIFYSLADPMLLIPEYISGLMDSLLSLRHLEAFLFSKEYNPGQLKCTNTRLIEFAIFIDNLDFGIIKKEEEFQDFGEDSDDESDSEENIYIKDHEKKEIKEILLEKKLNNKLSGDESAKERKK